jgi:hypothetical protein
MTAIVLILSTILLLIAPIAYGVSIVRGKTRPHRLTRLAVMAGLLLTFGSAISINANPGVLLLTGICAVQGVVIFILSLWRGMGGGKRLLDWVCFLIAIVGLVVWRLSGNALTGMWFAIFADFMAYLPAYVKTWQHPHTESHWFYTFSIAGAFLSLVAYPLEAASAFQIYIMACCLIMISCIYSHQIFSKVQSAIAKLW